MRLSPLVQLSLILTVYAGTADSATEKTVITYNMGLYAAIGLGVIPDPPPSREARRDAIIDELNNPANSADVVCLQEAYVGEDVDKIVEGVAATYPYSFSPLHDINGGVPNSGLDTTPACGYGLMQSFAFWLFIRCEEKYCLNVQSIEEAFRCLASNCLLRYLPLSQKCINCIITEGTISGVKQNCYPPVSYFPRRYRKMNNPGLLLLSKTSMTNTVYVDYHPTSKEYTGTYGYLKAQVSGIGQAVCTHVSKVSVDIYPEVKIRLREGITSYVGQNAVELNQLMTAFGSTSPVIILGDFNVGDAAGPNITALELANYQIMTSVFQTQSDDECTFCDAPENAYNGVRTRNTVDHVFYQGVTYIEGSSERIFDDVSVEGYPLSDHFGVKQTFDVSS